MNLRGADSNRQLALLPTPWHLSTQGDNNAAANLTRLIALLLHAYLACPLNAILREVVVCRIIIGETVFQPGGRRYS